MDFPVGPVRARRLTKARTTCPSTVRFQKDDAGAMKCVAAGLNSDRDMDAIHIGKYLSWVSTTIGPASHASFSVDCSDGCGEVLSTAGSAFCAPDSNQTSAVWLPIKVHR